MCFPSCACVSVSSDASVLFFFLRGESSHSLYFLSASFSGRHTEPRHEGVNDSVAQHSSFPPYCAPCCATLLQ